MSNYKRSYTYGASYFFTVVSYNRQPILCDPTIRTSLRKAIKETQNKLPFKIKAWVLLPDHLHCIWTLPKHDSDFSKRWGLIKRRVSLDCSEIYKKRETLSPSKRKHRESTLWQRRFWEHQIRNQDDFNNHLDYIHCNPVKHRLCNNPSDWPYSTIHKFIKQGKYPKNWAVNSSVFDKSKYGE